MEEMPTTRESGSFFEFPDDKNNDIVIAGYLLRKPIKKNKLGSWHKKYFILATDGRLMQARQKTETVPSIHQIATTRDIDSKSSFLFLQQRTKLVTSEFRDHCFEIRTPSEQKVVLAAASDEERSQWMEKLQEAIRNSPPRPIKVCLVGNSKSLQQQLLHNFFIECGQEKLAEDILAFAYKTDNVEINLNLQVTNEKVKLSITCVCETDFPMLRKLNYVDANAIMLCYNADSLEAFNAIEKVWYPEVRKPVEKGISLFLCGIHESNRSDTDDVIASDTNLGILGQSNLDTDDVSISNFGRKPQRLYLEETETKPESNGTIDRMVGEQMAEFVGANAFFDVSLDERRSKATLDGSDDGIGSTVSSKDQFNGFEGVAETFLDVLQATLEDADGSLIEEGESDVDDVANLDDFESPLMPLKRFQKTFSFMKTPMSFMQFVKGKANTNGKKVSHITGNDSESGDNIQPSAMMKIKMALKNLKPKRRKKKKRNMPELGEEDKNRAHFVSRHNTGSLIFLGEEFLEQ